MVGAREHRVTGLARWLVLAWLGAAALGCGGDTGGAAEGTSDPAADDGPGAGDVDGDAAGEGTSSAGGESGTAAGDGTGTGDATDGATGGDGAAGAGAGDTSAGTDAGGSGSVVPAGSDPGPDTSDAALATESGCAGVFNPDQLLDLHLTTSAGDWSTVLADASYSIFVPAQLHCGDDAPITVGVRRKRSGGQNKVAIKVDMNELVAGQTWYGLKKLNLDNGVSEGDDTDGAEVRAYVSEYLAWRMMVLSGAISGRAAFANLFVNDELVGVYVNIEQVDKRFLQDRLGDDGGWLYKKSGGVRDGLKTHEVDGLVDPYGGYFCFWENGAGACAVPSGSELLADLPAQLDIAQFLRFGAVNALIANTDGPLFKDNNYYYYDWAGGPRLYLPWDLDTAMKDSPSLFSGGVGGGANSVSFDEVLFTHWRDHYESILIELVQSRTPLSVVLDELDRAERVSAAAFASDVYVTGSAAEAVDALAAYWTGRFADVESELGL